MVVVFLYLIALVLSGTIAIVAYGAFCWWELRQWKRSQR